MDTINKAKISGIKLFKKNFERNINFSKSEKDTILKNLEPGLSGFFYDSKKILLDYTALAAFYNTKYNVVFLLVNPNDV